jgi:hypothetical protein
MKGKPTKILKEIRTRCHYEKCKKIIDVHGILINNYTWKAIKVCGNCYYKYGFKAPYHP